MVNNSNQRKKLSSLFPSLYTSTIYIGIHIRKFWFICLFIIFCLHIRRSSSSVERGTVHYLSIHPGDPLTPGYAATENATRLELEDSDAVPHIPSLPISWSDAKPLLKATENFGLRSEQDAQGGLVGVNYFSGPSQAQVNLVNINEYKVSPIWNVIGRIEGSEEPNRAIIIGNHRDAWGYGAADPSSGSAVMVKI